MRADWTDVTRSSPCPICQKPDRCQRTADGAIRCFRLAEPPPGWRVVKTCSDDTRVFRPEHDQPKRTQEQATASRVRTTERDWEADSKRLVEAITDERLGVLADSLGVHPAALRVLECGYADRKALAHLRVGCAGDDPPPDAAYSFPERDAEGQIIGISFRTIDGRKGFAKGAKRGLVYDKNAPPSSYPALVVEGPSDVAACLSIGLAAIGRFSNRGGADLLATLLKATDFIIVGENDPRVENGESRWPGREGAIAIATTLACEWDSPVCWTLPPDGAKDIRSWLNERCIDLNDTNACTAARCALLDHLCSTVSEIAPPKNTADEESSPKGPSQATGLVELGMATELFHCGDDAYATVDAGGHLETWPIRSKRYRRWIAKQYYDREQNAPRAQSLQEAIAVLEGQAFFEGPEMEVHVRVAGHEGDIFVDVGDPQWRAIRIHKAGWETVANPPVKFRRPRGMTALPLPVRGGSIEMLRRFINVENDRHFALLMGFIVAAIRPTGPYPVLNFGGEHGSAKSSASRFVRALIDPNEAPLRCEPRSRRDAAIAASNSWTVVLDNLSSIQPWLSDVLCRLATGGGFSTRELFSDDEETIFNATRPVIVNGIGDIATRADLLDRTIQINLPPIADSARRPEAELWRDFDHAAPAILGAIFNAVSAALRNRSSVRLEQLPRMADFAMWVVAAEEALPWRPGLFMEAYARCREESHELAIEESPVGLTVRQLAVSEGKWTGTASELQHRLITLAGHDPDRLPKEWPKRPNELSTGLRRIAPNLRAVGVEIEFHPRSRKQRLITLKWGGKQAENVVTLVTPVTDRDSVTKNGVVGDDPASPRDDAIVTQDHFDSPEKLFRDDRDDRDDPLMQPWRPGEGGGS